MIDFTLMDRLKVLNFDEDFRRDIKMRPMSRYYFLVESNPSEQFHVFTSLAAWLARKCGADLQPPLEDDDPNSTVSGILDATRSLGIAVDFSPNKLKQGFGEHVVYLLEKLSEKAVQSVGQDWRQLDIKAGNPSEGGSDDEEPGEEDEEEEDLEEVQGLPEEMEYSSGSDGEDVGNGNLGITNGNVEIYGANEMADWKGEVERVAPSLRIRIIPSARDWRTHTQQLITHRKELGQLSAAVGETLQRAAGRAALALEAVRARQVLLQERTAGALDRLARLRAQATAAVDNYKTASVGVTQRQEILSDLTDKVENVKQKTEMKGSAMNDQSPVVNIKRAVILLRKEIQEMDLQLAVLMWSVLEHQSRAKRNAATS